MCLANPTKHSVHRFGRSMAPAAWRTASVSSRPSRPNGKRTALVLSGSGSAISSRSGSSLTIPLTSVVSCIMTNAIESVNASFRKVTKKGAFENRDAVFKVLYLRIAELYKQWNGASLRNWVKVLNQLSLYDNLSERIGRFCNF